MNELQHFGIKGMRWGHRKAQSTAAKNAYRKKLAAIEKNKNLQYHHPDDYKRIKYRNRSLARRVGGVAAGHIAMDVMRTFINNPDGLASYARMNNVERAAKLATIATKTAAGVALKDALAKSVTTRYEDNGKRKRGIKNHLIEKEALIEIGVGAASNMIPVLYYTGKQKFSFAKMAEARNKKRTEEFMRDISPDKFVEASYSFTNFDLAVR